MEFWKNLGKGLAAVGKASMTGAVWCSQHPEVIAAVASVVGHPEVAAVAGAIIQAEQQRSSPPDVPPQS